MTFNNKLPSVLFTIVVIALGLGVDDVVVAGGLSKKSSRSEKRGVRGDNHNNGGVASVPSSLATIPTDPCSESLILHRGRDGYEECLSVVDELGLKVCMYCSSDEEDSDDEECRTIPDSGEIPDSCQIAPDDLFMEESYLVGGTGTTTTMARNLAPLSLALCANGTVTFNATVPPVECGTNKIAVCVEEFKTSKKGGTNTTEIKTKCVDTTKGFKDPAKYTIIDCGCCPAPPVTNTTLPGSTSSSKKKSKSKKSKKDDFCDVEED